MIRQFKNIKHQIKSSFLDRFSDTIWVYLKKSNSKGGDYDPYRQIGYSTSLQSPTPIKVKVRSLSPDSLIRREIGLVESGAIEIELDDDYVEAIRISEKIAYNKEYYVTYKQAAGNQLQITKSEFGISKIILFKIGN